MNDNAYPSTDLRLCFNILDCFWQACGKPQSKAGKAKKTKKSCKGRKPGIRKGMAASLIDKVLTTMDKHKEVRNTCACLAGISECFMNN